MTDDELTPIRARVNSQQRSADEAAFLMKMDARALLAEVERLRAREAQMCEIVQAVASLWVMDDCSNGNDFPQRRIYLYDRTDDGVPATDVVVVRDKARVLAGDDD